FASDGFSFARTSAVSFRYDNAEADVFTTLPVMFHVENPSREHSAHPYIQPLRTTNLNYAHVVDGFAYRTVFILVNTTDTATTATLEFYSDTGAPQPFSIGGVQRTTYPVPLGARSTARIVTDGASLTATWGWARLTAPIEGIG